MKEKYHCEDIHKALMHATAYGTFESKAVERILFAKSKPRALESLRDEYSLNRLTKEMDEE